MVNPKAKGSPHLLVGGFAISLEILILVNDHFLTVRYTDKEAPIVMAMIVGGISMISIITFVIWTSARNAWDRWAFALLLTWLIVAIVMTR